MAYPGDDEDHVDYETEEGVETWEEEEQLALADEDEDLPWLEADEYEEDEGGFDYRLILYAIGGLLFIGAVLFGLWWLTKDRPDPEMVPDQSTIEAPEGPYKQRPDEAGGAEVEGTGGQAFETAEGEQTRGRIDGQDGGDSPRPSIDREQSGENSGSEAAAGESDSASSNSSNNVYVQIGAFSSRSEAESAWNSATGRFNVLSGMRYRIVEGDVNGATVYRLQAVAGDRASADATCRSIRNAGGDCYIR